LNVKYDDTDYWYETNIFQQAADRNYWRLNEWRNLGERYKTLDPYELIDAINQHQYEFDVLKPMILASSWMKSRRSKFENLAEWVRWSEHGGYKKTTIRGSNIVKVCSPLGVNWSNC
jgi:predicted ATP-grasp superfamily ATP-dependent carboligase